MHKTINLQYYILYGKYTWNYAFIGHLIFSKQPKLLKQHNIKYMDVVNVDSAIRGKQIV